MLVEDDNSLREIYEARLQAEGYTVVSAKDGEEALALALKERPDLIIADVMMPKVSGFDMLDILRSTPETKATKIIMMTALSQAEDQARAKKLGADKYLVKSQVTLEDVIREAHNILAAQTAATDAAVSSVTGDKAVATPEQPAPKPPVPTVEAPAAVPPATPNAQSQPVSPAPATPVPTVPSTPTVTSIPVVSAPPDGGDSNDKTSAANSSPVAAPAPTSTTAQPSSAPAPVTDPPVPEELASTAKELSEPQAAEKKEVKEQLDEFIASNPTLSSSPDEKSDSNTDGQEPVPAADTAPTEAQQTVNDAVDSLLKDTSSEATPKDTGTKSPDTPTDASRGYVSEQGSGNSESQSMKHTKRIEPSPEITESKPSLDELLAKEGGDSSAPPPINSIITPNGP